MINTSSLVAIHSQSTYGNAIGVVACLGLICDAGPPYREPSTPLAVSYTGVVAVMVGELSTAEVLSV